MTKKIKKIFAVSFICSNLILLLFYLSACLVPFLNAGNHWFIALLGLAFPLLFFAILGFCIYWLIRKSKWLFPSVAALVLGWQQIAVSFVFNTKKYFIVTKQPETLRVLSWNLSSWGETNRYNWVKANYRNKMIDLIKKTGADVLCFQEYIFLDDPKFRDSIIPKLKEQGYLYSFSAKTNYTGRVYRSTRITSVIILSKYPFADTAMYTYGDKDLAEHLIYADVQFNKQLIRVFTTHLQSVSLNIQEYPSLDKLKNVDKGQLKESKTVIGKLKRAYQYRSIQADTVHQKIKESLYPVIVCGDFNDVPNSYTYFTIKDGLQDAFLKKGNGFGRTFRHISPTLRIDYIMADKKFTVKQFNKIEVPYSDHYPIVADIDVTEKN